MPAVTAEVCPNAHKGRILLCAAHPEYGRWSQGRIVEQSGEESACIGDGFRRWEGVDAVDVFVNRGLTGTWWMVRRFVAWAGKVPSGRLPPVERRGLSEAERAVLLPYVVWDGSRENQFLVI